MRRYLAPAGFLLWAALLLTQLSGCASPAYYAQAVSGHCALIRNRQDIDELLHDPDTPRSLAGKLEQSQAIRTFATEDLELRTSGSYRQYVATGRTAVTWNVVAAPEFSLEPKRWCFIVAGCVPYRGYFSEQDARDFSARMAGRGFDTSVTPVTAYSTLGWFDDPVLDTMLRYGEAGLAGVMIHEMAHQQLYVPGDTAFNESFAGFIEEIGVSRWLQSRDELSELQRWRNRQQAAAEFNGFLAAYRNRLEALYGQPLDAAEMRRRKQLVLDDMLQDYRALVEERWNGNDYFGSWFSGGVNNARLALADSYHGGGCAFRALYRSSDENMQTFLRQAGEKAALPAAERRAWLQQSCTVIAPEHDL